MFTSEHSSDAFFAGYGIFVVQVLVAKQLINSFGICLDIPKLDLNACLVFDGNPVYTRAFDGEGHRYTTTDIASAKAMPKASCFVHDVKAKMSEA